MDIHCRVRGEQGQSTVEAAFALPVLMLLTLLLLQPGIILYDRIVMEGAAAEGCRLLVTTKAPGHVEEDFIRRRLSAVPQTEIFHVHENGCSWTIVFEGNESTGEVATQIKGEVRPLPLLDVGMSLLGMTNEQGNLTIEVERHMQTQNAWVAASPDGQDPQGWMRAE